MKLSYFKGEYPNFGDDLNYWMWPKLLPNFFDNDDSVVFLGVGSIIGKRQVDHSEYRPGQTRVIFGSGFVATYHDQPVVDQDWDIFFVRGPRTAKVLGVAPELGIGDSGILLRTIVDYKNRKPEFVGFMPHWQSLERGNWQEVCDKAGLKLIDPRREVDEVISDLLKCKYIVTEAMHGAIITDAFRIPWIPVLPISSDHRDKWYDWAEALDLQLQRNRLWPSSLAELRLVMERKPLLVGMINLAEKVGLKTLCNKTLVYLCARNLKSLARQPTSLSSDNVMETVTSKMLEKLEQLKRAYGKKQSAADEPQLEVTA